MTLTDTDIPLLLTPPSFEEAERLGLPSGDDNLFTRIIRDPTNPDRPMRERQCAELLCGLLRNLPSFRSLFIQWLSNHCNGVPEDLEALQWTIDTEYVINGSKRIDLVLEAADKVSGVMQVCWAMEIKVAAGFHYSSSCRPETEEAEESDAETTGEMVVQDEMVNQLVNYDRWLADQPDQHKKGFVLAVYDMTSELPTNLEQKWICLTWGQLAQLITEAIEDDKVPESESVLSKNFLGFVNEHLRGPMVNKLDFNTIAFLKAYYAYGSDFEATINNLVAPIRQMFEASSLELQDVNFQKTLYSKYGRSIVYSTLEGEFKLFAGINRDLCVVIDSAPDHRLKEAFRKQLQATSLGNSGSGWTIEKDPNRFEDACMKMPLTKLLDVDDQAKAVQEFVEKGLSDLQDIKVKAIIQDLK